MSAPDAGPLFTRDDRTVGHAILHCRICGYKLDSAMCVNHPGDMPSDGSFSVCFNCGEVSVYVIGVLGVALRETSMGELAEFSRRWPHLVTALTLFRNQRGFDQRATAPLGDE